MRAHDRADRVDLQQADSRQYAVQVAAIDWASGAGLVKTLGCQCDAASLGDRNGFFWHARNFRAEEKRRIR
jgi:hypothetical protein